jgi:hypothetical protein
MDYKHRFKNKNNVLKEIGNMLNIVTIEAESKLRNAETSRKCLCFARCVNSGFTSASVVFVSLVQTQTHKR